MHIRDRILRGAVFLSARQVLGVVVRGGGALLLLRLLGPVEYGLYAGSAAIVVFLALVAPLGVDVYLLQREEEPSEQIQDQAFSFLLVSSLAAVAVGLLLSIGVVRALPDPGFTAPFRALLLAVPLEVLWVLARARMERSLRFGRLAALELGADVVFYIVSLGLALRGFGVWAPVAGYVVRQTCQLIAGYVVAGCRPRWDWSPSALREPLRYGIGYSSSRWITESSGLINPLLVGGLLGPAAVGYVAVATSLVDALGFVKTATTRLGIAAFARIQNETERLRNAHREGTVLQVLGTAPLLAGAALLAPLVAPHLLATTWEPVVGVFALCALGAAIGSLFKLHSSVLHACDLNMAVLRVRIVRLVLLLVAALVLIPRAGVLGYGVAVLVRLAGLFLADRELRRLFPPRYREALPWLLVCLPPMLAPWVPWPWTSGLLVPAPARLSMAGPRAELAKYLRYMRGALSGGVASRSERPSVAW